MQKYIIIFCTTPSQEISMKIASECVNKKIAACCNILPGITSIYRWHEKVEKNQEQLLIFKTTEDKFQAIEKTINELHPYDVPEIISVKINDANDDYLKWIDQSQG